MNCKPNTKTPSPAPNTRNPENTPPAAPPMARPEMALIFSPAQPFADLRQEKMILHKCSLVLCTKMG